MTIHSKALRIAYETEISSNAGRHGVGLSVSGPNGPFQAGTNAPARASRGVISKRWRNSLLNTAWSEKPQA